MVNGGSIPPPQQCGGVKFCPVWSSFVKLRCVKYSKVIFYGREND